MASFGSLIVDDFVIVRVVLGGVLASFGLVVGVGTIIGRVFGVAVGGRVGFFGSGRCQGTVTKPNSLAPSAIASDRLRSDPPFQEALGPIFTWPSVSTFPSMTPSQTMPSPE